MVLLLLPFLFIGKKQHDKRDDIKEREWKVAKERIMKNANRG